MRKNLISSAHQNPDSTINLDTLRRPVSCLSKNFGLISSIKVKIIKFPHLANCDKAITDFFVPSDT